MMKTSDAKASYDHHDQKKVKNDVKYVDEIADIQYSIEPDFFPPLELDPCSEMKVTIDHRHGCRILQNSQSGGFWIGRELQKGKSPVHEATLMTIDEHDQPQRTNQSYALKIYPRAVIENYGRSSAEDAIKELKVLTLLRGRHPNIIGSLCNLLDQETRQHYLIMPLIPGGDAITLLEEQGGPLPFPLARLCMKDLFSALHYLHTVLGICHHDISPEQMMWDPLYRDSSHPSGRFILIDFGMCLRLGRDPNSGEFLPYPRKHSCGKSNYWPPEMSQESSFIPFPRDMFSCGATLFMLLFGKSLKRYAQERGLQESQYYRHISAFLLDPVNPDRKFLRTADCNRGTQLLLACDLAGRLMKMDPVERLTSEQALQHEWILINDHHPSDAKGDGM